MDYVAPPRFEGYSLKESKTFQTIIPVFFLFPAQQKNTSFTMETLFQLNGTKLFYGTTKADLSVSLEHILAMQESQIENLISL